MERVCRHHGLTEYGQSGRNIYCKKCNVENVSRRRKKIKRILVDEHGGACVICGYDRYAGAMHFHHLDPDTKEFDISRNASVIAIARLRAEAEKCVLLCHNCHDEVEAGITELPRQVSPRSDKALKG